LTVGDKPSVVMINKSPGIQDDLRIVRSALRARQQAVVKRLRLVISGYSSDVARGIRIQRWSKMEPDAREEVS
jgi:hypothetical protein